MFVGDGDSQRPGMRTGSPSVAKLNVKNLNIYHLHVGKRQKYDKDTVAVFSNSGIIYNTIICLSYIKSRNKTYYNKEVTIKLNNE